MKTDLYTKAVLTVIAISLAGIAVQLTINDAHAQNLRPGFPAERYPFAFTQSGALIVAVCHPNGSPSRYVCADPDKLEH